MTASSSRHPEAPDAAARAATARCPSRRSASVRAAARTSRRRRRRAAPAVPVRRRRAGPAGAAGARAGTRGSAATRSASPPRSIETTKQVLTAPAAFFRAMPVTGGIGSPLLYAVIVGYVGLVISALYNFVLRERRWARASRASAADPRRWRGWSCLLPGRGGLVVQADLRPGRRSSIGLFLLSGDRPPRACMLLGGAARGFEATFRVACYSEAAALLNIVPVCGGLIAPSSIRRPARHRPLRGARDHPRQGGGGRAAALRPLCCCCVAGAHRARFGRRR